MKNNRIGQHITEIRTGLGITIRQMATGLQDEIDITPARLNDYELGNKIPNREFFGAVENVYGVTVDAEVVFMADKLIKQQENNISNRNISPVTICYTRDKKTYSYK